MTPCLLVLFIMVAAALPARAAPERVTVFPAPPGEPASADYRVTVNGKPAFCYTSYRFDTTSPVTIAGRPVSPISFCSFDAEGPVTVDVEMLDGLARAGIDTSRVVVRPLAHGIRPKVVDGRVRFTVRGPCQLSLEPGGGLQHPLHLFVNPPEQDVPSPADPNVRYFGPGAHDVTLTELRSGETLYIAGGAVVNLKPAPHSALLGPHELYGETLRWAPGLFHCGAEKGVTVRGRGILCGRKGLALRQRGALLRFDFAEDVTVEGVIIRESPVWSLNFVNCRRVHVRNVKIVGHYVNNDGIAIGGTSDALVEDCFAHNADDTMEVKTWIPQRNVTFRNCVVWNDVGGSLGLMHECDAEVGNVVYERCTVIHSTDDMSACPVAGIKLTGTGSARGFRFEDIVIEDVRGARRPALKVINNWDDWHVEHPTKPNSPYELADPPRRERPSGAIRGVVFRNVRVLRCVNRDVALISDGPESPIEDIVFDNVVIAGRRLVAGDRRIKANAWVGGITVR